MGDGVTGSTNAPTNQPTNAGRSGDTSAADAAAKAKFGEALNQENLCPPGLGRRQPEGCTYLRPPSHPSQPEKKIELTVHNDPGSSKGPTNRSDGPDFSKPINTKIDGDPDRFKGPMSGPRSDGPDLTKPIPKKPDSSPKLPDTRPFHDTTPSGTHVFGVEGKI